MKRTGVARAPSHKGEQLRDKVDAQLASIKKTPRLVQPFSNPIWGFRLSYGQNNRLSGCFGCHNFIIQGLMEFPRQPPVCRWEDDKHSDRVKAIWRKFFMKNWTCTRPVRTRFRRHGPDSLLAGSAGRGRR